MLNGGLQRFRRNELVWRIVRMLLESWKTTLSPYDGRVALADRDVVGGPLHIHAPDGESCGDKTQESE